MSGDEACFYWFLVAAIRCPAGAGDFLSDTSRPECVDGRMLALRRLRVNEKWKLTSLMDNKGGGGVHLQLLPPLPPMSDNLPH